MTTDIPQDESSQEEVTGEEAISQAQEEAPEVQKLAEVEAKYLRLYAEFENYKKRAMKEREEIRLLSQERLLRDVVEIKDHLELALDHATQGTSVEGLKEGVTLTLRQMIQFLEKTGVKEIKSLGEMFDPNRHEAIGQIESPEPTGMILQEFQKAYLFNDRLLRPSRVMVAKAKS